MGGTTCLEAVVLCVSGHGGHTLAGGSIMEAELRRGTGEDLCEDNHKLTHRKRRCDSYSR